MAKALHSRTLLHADLFAHSTAADAQLRAQNIANRIGLRTATELDGEILKVWFSGHTADVSEFLVQTRAENIDLERVEASEDWQRRMLAANAAPATRVCRTRMPRRP